MRPAGFIGVFLFTNFLKMNSYELSRNFVDWAFENPDKIKPIHYGIYYFAIEHCNRLGWKDKFGLPSQMVMEAIGVKNWRTYSYGLYELVDFGFIEMIETSKNQYSSNIIAIVKNTKAHTKALDKALQKHSTKHSTKQSKSTVSIDKQLNNITSNNITNNNVIDEIKDLPPKPKKEIVIPDLFEFLEYVKTIPEYQNQFESLKFSIQSKYESWIDNGWKDGHNSKIVNWKTKLKNVLPYLKPQQNATTTNFTKPTITDRNKATLERFDREREEFLKSKRGND